MSPLSIAVLSLSMSADAFAAAIGRGASQRPSIAGAVRAGLVFGAIEAVTPVIGWALGLAAATVIASIDHWIAFGLLAMVGAKMAYQAARGRTEDAAAETPRSGGLALVATAVGTSIDAAAVGVTLAFLNANIVAIALSIGLATFAMATLGMVIGRAAGVKLGAAVEFVAGIALIGLGLKILLEHTGFIA